MAVKQFYADILARNSRDGSRVLIENQLEGGDHGHLGQILTYLAGLEAHTVIWIASSFSDAHLSALKWLNEHTVEPFSFFAVKVRAVRIGDSQVAPIFEVVERPNDWERQIEAAAKEAQELSPLGKRRREFWEAFVARFPDESGWGAVTAGSNRWRHLADLGLTISFYIAQKHVGVFIRGPNGAAYEVAYDHLLPHADRLAAALGSELERTSYGYHFGSEIAADTSNRATWPELISWLRETTDKYEKALREIFEEPV